MIVLIRFIALVQLSAFILYCLIFWIKLIQKRKPKKSWMKGCLLLLLCMALTYLLIFCDLPMQPRMNESTFEQGLELILDKADASKDGTYEIKVKNDKTTGVIQVETFESNEAAYDRFKWDNVYSNRVVPERTKDYYYAYTKCIRPRTWTYFGIAEGASGDLSFVKGNRYVNISYIYNRNKFENFCSALFPPETFYREKVDVIQLAKSDEIKEQTEPEVVDWWSLE